MTKIFLIFLLALPLLAQQPQRQISNDGDSHGDAPYLVESGWMPLLNGKDLSGWHGQNPAAKNEWLTTNGIAWERLLGPTRLSANPTAGDRILNGTGRTVNLVTDQKFGDMELYLEFMIAKGSNSGVYLHGLYEVQIFDSWGATEEMSTSDSGAIYHRWIDNQGVGGSAPSRNASRRPGEWQSYQIWFRAPRFDSSGKKIENAKFLRVVHNGLSVQKTWKWKARRGRRWTLPKLPRTPLWYKATTARLRFGIFIGGHCVN